MVGKRKFGEDEKFGVDENQKFGADEKVGENEK